jgi:hypothetical protein
MINSSGGGRLTLWRRRSKQGRFWRVGEPVPEAMAGGALAMTV